MPDVIVCPKCDVLFVGEPGALCQECAAEANGTLFARRSCIRCEHVFYGAPEEDCPSCNSPQRLD